MCRANSDVRAVICVFDHRPLPTPAVVVRARPTSDSGVAAQLIVEALPWGTAPVYLERDNDAAYERACSRSVPQDRAAERQPKIRRDRYGGKRRDRKDVAMGKIDH